MKSFNNLRIATRLWMAVILFISALLLLIAFAAVRSGNLAAESDRRQAQADAKITLASRWSGLTEVAVARGVDALFSSDTALGELVKSANEKPIAENPHTTFILGHAGALQLEAAMELCRKYPNIYMEISSQGLAGVRTLLERGNPDKILLGSDFPFYSAALPIARVLIVTEERRELRRKIFWDNAARLLGIA